MRAARQNDRITLSFGAFESQVLLRILSTIIQNYKIKPAEMGPKEAAVWYSTRGCESAKMSAEETRDWLEQLHGFRSANLDRLEDWAKQLTAAKEDHFELRVPLAEAEKLITLLNDHRLFAAARHDIGQQEMDLRSLAAFNALTPVQLNALYEIHFLACLIEALLRLLPNSGADWQEW
jgi:hypothetical protein